MEHLQHLRLALVSKTGSGKSSLGNLMLSRKAFDVSRGFSSATVRCKAASGVVEGRRVTIVDSPGTMDTRDPEAALRELVNAIQLSPEGFHAFLIVVKASVRYTDEEHAAIQALRQIFGDRLFDFSIVVFTHGDHFDNDENELKEALQQDRRQQPTLDELLSLCSNRVALIDNDRRCDPQVQKRQIVSLLEKIEDLVSRNNGLYTDRIFQVAQQEAEKKRREEERRENEREEMEKRQREEIERVKRDCQDLQRQQQEMERLRMQQAAETEQQTRRHVEERETEKVSSFLAIATAIGGCIGKMLGNSILGSAIGAVVGGGIEICKSCSIQ